MPISLLHVSVRFFFYLMTETAAWPIALGSAEMTLPMPPTWEVEVEPEPEAETNSSSAPWPPTLSMGSTGAPSMKLFTWDQYCKPFSAATDSSFYTLWKDFWDMPNDLSPQWHNHLFAGSVSSSNHPLYSVTITFGTFSLNRKRLIVLVPSWWRCSLETAGRRPLAQAGTPWWTCKLLFHRLIKNVILFGQW